MNHYSYANLGNSCEANAVSLTDNSHYLPPSLPIYKMPFTVTYQYPSDTYYPRLFDQLTLDKPEDLKNTIQQDPVKTENYKSCSSCSFGN